MLIFGAFIGLALGIASERYVETLLFQVKALQLSVLLWPTVAILGASVLAALPFSTDDKRDGISGIAFAMHNIAPLLLMSDQGDIGLSIDRETIFLYDNYPGGIGFSEPLFAMHDELLARTRELIDECPCESGCPSCVGPIGSTGPHTKKVAQDMLRRLGTAPQ